MCAISPLVACIRDNIRPSVIIAVSPLLTCCSGEVGHIIGVVFLSPTAKVIATATRLDIELRYNPEGLGVTGKKDKGTPLSSIRKE